MKPELRARHAALLAIDAVMHRRQPLETALDAMRNAALPARDAAFAQALTMAVLRRAGEADAILSRFLQKPLDAKLALAQHALRLGVAQLLWLATPPHAAIATTVDLMKAIKQPKLAGLANAVLRRVAEQKDALAAERAGWRNLPDWLRASWESTYGRAAMESIANALAEEPPLDLTLRADGALPLDAERVGPRSVRLKTTDVAALPGYAQGEWWVQDVAASLPALLLGDVRGQRVYDLCAAPGGKTAQLAVAGAQVLAVDRSEKRLRRLRENMERLQLTVETQTADLLDWQPAQPADAILLDAPCTATGTIRRHPDILYQREASNSQELASLQAGLLARAASWLAPGGRLVYCVCSLQPEEGEAQIASFLRLHPGFRLDAIDPAAHDLAPQWVHDGMLRTLPHDLPGGMDGFFAARLIRQP